MKKIEISGNLSMKVIQGVKSGLVPADLEICSRLLYREVRSECNIVLESLIRKIEYGR